jgi:hypothetical protein
MAEIWLSEEQSLRLQTASFPIVLLDSQGMKIGEFRLPEAAPIDESSMTEDDWVKETLRRKEQAEREGGIFYTTKEVLEHLRSLEPE